MSDSIDVNLPATPKNNTSIPTMTEVKYPSAQILFSIALGSVFVLLCIFISEKLYGQTFGAVNENDPAWARFLIPNVVYLIVAAIGFGSLFIGFKLISAAGATTANVIPPQDYALLSSLIADGKSESIDQYVRLSSLTRFTGSFTHLGLTGLPLATIGLTIFFTIMSLIDKESFLDLAKLTLGAFVGSFVQRQVERSSGPMSDKASGESPQSYASKDA